MTNRCNIAEERWRVIRHDYESGEYTIKNICSRHGVSLSQLYRRAKLEVWNKKRNNTPNRNNITPAATDLIYRLYSALEKQISRLEKRLKICKDLHQDQSTEIGQIANLTQILDKLAGIERSIPENKKTSNLKSKNQIEDLRKELKERLTKMCG